MLTLGSLFDGSGGFPLGGAICGIKPVWSSEIEPYPLRVTAARFPDVKQLGDVTKINGAEIEPVDIITFGSPCQDLSVAGAQKGIHDGERSNLFFEAIRIIKEMREHDKADGRSDDDIRPRFAVWENVPGAFSSNGGEDFRAVLKAFAGVRADGLDIPRPPHGKWSPAGGVVGDGWSVAWRVYDAQYWGVPQRRKRIYLVADFGSERAPQILFERESVCGDPAEGGEAREGTAGDAEGSAGGSSIAFKERAGKPGGGKGILPAVERAFTLSNTVVQSVCHLSAFMGGQGAKARSIAYCDDGTTPTIRAAESGSNQVPNVCYPTIARALCARADSSPCLDRGQNVECMQNTGRGWWNRGEAGATLRGGDPAKANLVVALDCRNFVGNEGLSGTLQAKSNGGQSLNFINPVVYDSRGNGDGAIVPALTGDHERRVTDYTGIVAENSGRKHGVSDTIDASYWKGPGARNGNEREIVCTQNAEPPRKYIVRRLTPLECCRLQGFPDWWEDGVEGTDSARYKMWGNGVALPCVVDVLGRIAKEGYDGPKIS